MTVAAGIETGAGGHTGPGQALHQAKGPGKTQGAVRAVAAQVSSSPKASGAPESFRSNWQAQFASLTSGLDTSKAGSDSPNEIDDPADALTHEAGVGAPAAFPAALTGMAVSLKTGKQQPGSQMAKLAVAMPWTRVGDAAPWLAAQAPRRSEANGRVAGSTLAKASQSPTLASWHSSGTSGFGKSAWGAAPPVQIAEVAMSSPVAAANPSAPISIEIPTPLQMVPATTATNSTMPTGFAANISSDVLTSTDGFAQSANGAAGAQTQVRAETQSTEVEPRDTNDRETVSGTGAAIDSPQAGRTLRSATAVPSNSGLDETEADNAVGTGVQLRASAQSSQVDPVISVVPGTTVRTGRAQQSSLLSMDAGSGSGLPETAKTTSVSVGVHSPAKTLSGSMPQAHTRDQEAVVGEGTRFSETPHMWAQTPEIRSYRPQGLGSFGEGTIAGAKSGLSSEEPPAILKERPEQASSSASSSSSAEIGFNRPDEVVSVEPGISEADGSVQALVALPAPSESSTHPSATGQYPVETSTTRPEMQTSFVSGSRPEPIQAAGFGTAQPLAQGRLPISSNPPVTAAVSATGNSDLTVGKAEPVQGPQRSARGAGAEGRRSPSIQASPVAVSGEPSVLVRDPAMVPVVPNLLSGHAPGSVMTTPDDAFAALDAAAAPGRPTWTHATPRQAEAGFEDPALGWVSVRADLSGGGIHASLVPGSAQAAQDLGKHMDGLNTYLAEQHTQVDSLVVASPVGRGAGSTADDGSRQGMQQGMDQGTNQGTDHGANQRSGQDTQQQQAYAAPESSISLRMTRVDGTGPVQTSAAMVEADGSAQSRRGMHISVVA